MAGIDAESEDLTAAIRAEAARRRATAGASIEVSSLDTSGDRPQRGEVITKESILDRRIREAEEAGQRIGTGTEEMNAALIGDVGPAPEIEVEEADFELDPENHGTPGQVDETEILDVFDGEPEPAPVVREPLRLPGGASHDFLALSQNGGISGPETGPAILDIATRDAEPTPEALAAKADTDAIREDLSRIFAALLVVGEALDVLVTESTKPRRKFLGLF